MDVADERTMLKAWLDYHSATLLLKCADLSNDQLKLRSADPSSLSLLGLIRHMTDVERGWFRRGVAGEREMDVSLTDVLGTLTMDAPQGQWCQRLRAPGGAAAVLQ
jgi:uncharacterized damage-inducible protein DinB